MNNLKAPLLYSHPGSSLVPTNLADKLTFSEAELEPGSLGIMMKVNNSLTNPSSGFMIYFLVFIVASMPRADVTDILAQSMYRVLTYDGDLPKLMFASHFDIMPVKRDVS